MSHASVIQFRVKKGSDLGKRLRIAAATAGMSYHDYVSYLLDKEESRQRRQRAQMASPLHRPAANVPD